MEIDFLGVGQNSGFPSLKEEEEDGTKDSTTPESARTLEMQWSFTDKVSKPSQMLSFQASLEENTGKTTRGFDPKPLDNSFQNNALDMPAQRCYTVNGFPLQQFHAQPVGFNHEMKKFPFLSHPSQPIVNAPVIQSLPPVLSSPHFPVGHTTILSTSHPQMRSSTCRDTNAPKFPGASAQLTIFFAGSVYVYGNVSPDKAQAIMSLARSSSSVSPSQPVSTTQVQSQHFMPSLDEACNRKKPSMMSFSSSHTPPANSQQVIMTPPSALLPGVAIPQARKVSLARFLERRKERIIKASPYGINKSSSEQQSGVPSDNLSCSTANSTGSIFKSNASHK